MEQTNSPFNVSKILDKFCENDSFDGFDTEESKETAIRDIKVNQTWVDRAKDFVSVFFVNVETDDVDRQFRTSEFTDFNDFLTLNGLHFMESHYIMAKTKHQIIKSEIVEKCYEKAHTELTIKDFCLGEDIVCLKNSYVRVTTQYPKSKLLEILFGLEFASMADNEGYLTADLLDQLFQSKPVSLKIMLACYLAGIGNLLTSDGRIITYSQQGTLSLPSYPIGLVVDKNFFKVLEEWTGMTLDYLATGGSSN